MNYSVIVPLARFDLGMVNWLTTNVSLQAVLWKVEIDVFNRRVVYFTKEQDSLEFKNTFKL